MLYIAHLLWLARAIPANAISCIVVRQRENLVGPFPILANFTQRSLQQRLRLHSFAIRLAPVRAIVSRSRPDSACQNLQGPFHHLIDIIHCVRPHVLIGESSDRHAQRVKRWRQSRKRHGNSVDGFGSIPIAWRPSPQIPNAMSLALASRSQCSRCANVRGSISSLAKSFSMTPKRFKIATIS